MSYTARQVLTIGAAEMVSAQEAKMRALAATATGYLALTLWAAAPSKPDAAKATVRALALELGIDPVTYGQYGSHAVNAALILAKAPDDKNFLKVRDANDAQGAVEAMLALLLAKGVRNPHNLMTWSKAGTGGHLSTEAKPKAGLSTAQASALDAAPVNAASIKADAKAAKAQAKADAKAGAKALMERGAKDPAAAGADILAMIAGLSDPALLNKIAIAVSERMIAVQAEGMAALERAAA